jgi:hypothetical protein
MVIAPAPAPAPDTKKKSIYLFADRVDAIIVGTLAADYFGEFASIRVFDDMAHLKAEVAKNGSPDLFITSLGGYAVGRLFPNSTKLDERGGAMYELLRDEKVFPEIARQRIIMLPTDKEMELSVPKLKNVVSVDKMSKGYGQRLTSKIAKALGVSQESLPAQRYVNAAAGELLTRH